MSRRTRGGSRSPRVSSNALIDLGGGNSIRVVDFPATKAIADLQGDISIILTGSSAGRADGPPAA